LLISCKQVQVFDKETYEHSRERPWTFLTPHGIAFTPAGDLVVVDGDSVLVLRDSASTGTQLVCSFGSIGSEEGMFLHPRGVGVAADGSIIVADYGNCRVQIFDHAGCFRRSFMQAYQPGVLVRPSGIAVGEGGEIVVTDHKRAEVYVFRANGVSLVQKISSRGDSHVHLENPWGVAIDVDGNLYVASQCALHGHLSKLGY
jgi:tripartite motif-containing protein 71